MCHTRQHPHMKYRAYLKESSDVSSQVKRKQNVIHDYNVFYQKTIHMKSGSDASTNSMQWAICMKEPTNISII